MDDNERLTQPIEAEEPPAAVWGRLIAKSSGLANQQLSKGQISIGRKTTNTIVINDQRLSGVHCVLTRAGEKVYIEDRSSNGTFVNNTKMSKGAKLELQHGNQIWLLHQSKVTAESALGYQIELESKLEQLHQQKSMEVELEVKKKQEEIAAELKKKNEEEMKKIEDEKKKLTEQSNQLLKSIKDQITCCICLEVMHLPVTVHPCNHRFCGACLTGLIKAKTDHCAQCRKEITTAQRDSSFNTLIEDFLKRHPEDKRSKEDQQANEKANMFGYDAVNIHEFIHGKKVVAPVAARGRPRGRPARVVRGASGDLSASSSSDSPPARCPECRLSRNGFRCPAGQAHSNCVTCGKGIAQRGDPALNQCCVLCDQYFCNLYNPPCATFGVKLARVMNRESEVRIDQNTFRGNSAQFNIFKDYMREKKVTSKDVFAHTVVNHMDTGNFRFVVDRKVMKIPPLMSREIPVTKESAVCDICWLSLWFQIVLNYRVSIAAELPEAVRRRADCYYGVNCGTMTHKPDHAKKLNHCCYQTRF